MKSPRLFALAFAMFSGAVSLLAQPVKLAPTDSLVRYVGRFDNSDPAGPRCAWTASAVSLTFEGTSLDVTLSDGGRNFWQVVVDGKPTGVLALKYGANNYSVVHDLPAGRHTVELVKRTEFSQGQTQVMGFELSEGAKVLPTPARAHRIEVIGDSISCGYGNEAAGKDENFTSATENGWQAYGAVAARALGADYVCIAWSGKKLWPDNSILDHYDRVLSNNTVPKWNFSAWTPDVVVVNLGTNDFQNSDPNREGWVAAYVALITRIRSQYPKAHIYCALGTMMSDWPPERKPRQVILGYLDDVVSQANTAGGLPVRLIDFGVQDQANGLGANWHPSVKTHALMGAQLADALKRDLGW